MQFEIIPYNIPESIVFNYDELKRELVERTEVYKTLVYTEDQIKEARSERAAMNKLKDALNAERIRQQKIYMKPFEEFKAKVDDLIATINGASSLIDKQIKEYEEAEKKEKETAIQAMFETVGAQPFVTLSRVWNPKWLNKSYTMKQIEQDMRDFVFRVSQEIMTLNSIPEKDVAIEYYKKTLNLNDAIHAAQEHARIEQMKAQAAAEAEERRKEREEAARKAAEEAQAAQTAEPVNQAPEYKWTTFDAYVSVEKALKLKKFCDAEGIKLRPHKGE